MKLNILRILALLPGIPMLLNGIGYLVQPKETAASLGMTLLDGIARSSQIADGASFFVGVAVLIFVGAYRARGQWLFAGAMFIGGAALARVIAATLHGAEMATTFITAEVVLTIWLCIVAVMIDKARD